MGRIRSPGRTAAAQRAGGAAIDVTGACLLVAGWVFAAPVAAGPPAVASVSVVAPPTPVATQRGDTLLILSGQGELEVDNDEAVASFWLEQQDADPARAQSQLNRLVAEGVAALKRSDPKASVETGGYGSTPVYAQGARRVVGWRARQSVVLRTTDLAALPRTVASAQATLALGAIDFRLSRSARQRTEARLIELAVANLQLRIAAAAGALGVPADRVRIEEIDFGGAPPAMHPPMAMAMRASGEAAVVEPALDPGRTLERLSLRAKVRLLPG